MIDWFRNTDTVIMVAQQRTASMHQENEILGSTYYYSNPSDTLINSVVNEIYTFSLMLRKFLADKLLANRQ